MSEKIKNFGEGLKLAPNFFMAILTREICEKPALNWAKRSLKKKNVPVVCEKTEVFNPLVLTFRPPNKGFGFFLSCPLRRGPKDFKNPSLEKGLKMGGMRFKVKRVF